MEYALVFTGERAALLLLEKLLPSVLVMDEDGVLAEAARGACIDAPGVTCSGAFELANAEPFLMFVFEALNSFGLDAACL